MCLTTLSLAVVQLVKTEPGTTSTVRQPRTPRPPCHESQPARCNGRHRRNPCRRKLGTESPQGAAAGRRRREREIRFHVVRPCEPSLPDTPTLQASFAASQYRPTRRKRLLRKGFTPTGQALVKNVDSHDAAGGPSHRPFRVVATPRIHQAGGGATISRSSIASRPPTSIVATRPKASMAVPPNRFSRCGPG